MTTQDNAEIVELLNLYGLALDAHRWDLFDLVFTDDVVAEFGPAGAAWTGLADFKQSFAGFHQTLDSHQHTMMGQVVKVEGDQAYAFSYGNWLLVRHTAEGGPTWQGTGWYDDTLVCTEAGWRIAHRVCRLVAWTGNPAVPQPEGDHHPDMDLNVLHQASESGQIALLNALRQAD
jgi:SnoaL-like domain